MPRIGDDMDSQSGVLGFLCDLQKFGLAVHPNTNLGHSESQPLLDGMVLGPNICVTKAMDQEHDAGVCALGNHLAFSHVEIVPNDNNLLESAHRSPGPRRTKSGRLKVTASIEHQSSVSLVRRRWGH